MATQEDLYTIRDNLLNVDIYLGNFFTFLVQRLYKKDFENFRYKDDIVKASEVLEDYFDKLSRAQPGSFYAKQKLEGLYNALNTKVKPLLNKLKTYEDWRKMHWAGFQELDEELKRLESVEPYVEKTIGLVGHNIKYLEALQMEGKLSNARPRPKKKPEAEAEAEAVAVTTVGKVVAMLAVLALGFTVLGGLNNLGAASLGGGLPDMGTGFYLLPGSVYITSLQMVLFMLASAVVVMYLAGKSLGGW